MGDDEKPNDSTPPSKQSSSDPVPKPVVSGPNPFDALLVQETGAMALKLPDFDHRDVVSWFFLVESAFYNSNIKTEITKYHRTVPSLGVENIRRMRAFFDTNPVAQPNPYTLLKETVIAHFRATTYDQLERLLMGMSLGDMRPSELLGEMRSTVGVNMSDVYLEPFWLKRLPTHAQGWLSAMDCTLAQKAGHADRMMDKVGSSVFHQSAPVNVQETMSPRATTPGEISVASSPMDVLVSLCQKMDQRLSMMEKRSRAPDRWEGSRDRRPNSARKRSVSRGPASATPGICWYHEVFGKDAQKCRDGCNYKPKN